MRVAFIPALPPSALMGGMIAPSSRLVNRFSRKKREKHSGEGAERQRFERPSGARNAPHRTAPLATPEPPARTSRQRFGEPQLSKVKSESPVPSPNLRLGEGIPREHETGCPFPASGLPR